MTNNSLIADAPLAKDSTRKSRLPVVFRFIFGAAIIGVLLWKTDLSHILAVLVQMDLFWLAMAFLIQIGGKIIWAARWSVLLQIFEIYVPFFRLVKGLMVGLFFGNFLPTSVGGDFYRGYWILESKQQYPKSLFVIFIERLIGLVTLGFVALPAIPFLFTKTDTLQGNLLVLFFVLVALCSSVFLIHPAIFSTFDHLFQLVFRTALLDSRNKVRSALLTLHAAGSKRLMVYAYSLATQLVGIFFYYFIGRGIGLNLELWHYFIIVPLTVVATLAPISLNGFGVREGVLVVLTTTLGTGVTPAQAVALGLVATAVGLGISLIGGGFYVAGNRNEIRAI